MTDRRRINGPAGMTSPPVFAPSSQNTQLPPRRTRPANELRRVFLQTGLIPSVSGSAYLELEAPQDRGPSPSLALSRATIKLSCSVQGPKPLPRSASFSPNLQLSASVKFAPFGTRLRHGYVRDAREKDLGRHLENALKGVVIPDRWPKSAVDVAVTVLESESDPPIGDEATPVTVFNTLAACINVAMAALADAQVDCLDLLSAGVAALALDPGPRVSMVLDPAPAEHDQVLALCLVGYLPARDEIVEIWTNGLTAESGTEDVGRIDQLMDSAIAAARGAYTVLRDVMPGAVSRGQITKQKARDETKDVDMIK